MRNLALSALALGIVAAASNAAIITYNFPLDGNQEVPAVDTPATGLGTVTLDTVSGAVSVVATFQNLKGGIVNAHIHGLALPGSNAGVILLLSFTAGQTTGVVTGNGVLNATNIQGMIDGKTYVNIHSSFKTSGEIRGQVVPAPASLAMLGLAGIAVGRRRR
jgi:CHRD domain